MYSGCKEAEITVLSKGEIRWYAVVSRSRHEKLVSAALTNMGIITFLPLVTEMHHWSDRQKIVQVPLFPGYVFVQTPNSPEAQLTVLKTSGVVQFVGNRHGAVPITDKEITDVRAVLDQKLGCSPHPFLELGQRVRIRGGCLDGVEGILVGRGSASKLVISIQLIQRSLAVSVCNFDVEPISNPDVSVGSRIDQRAAFNANDVQTLALQSRIAR
jgi:transcription antitermination factor NusG